MPTGDIMREQAVLTLPLRQWAAAEASSAVSELEQGKVLFLPELAFTLSEQEMPLLDPTLVDPAQKHQLSAAVRQADRRRRRGTPAAGSATAGALLPVVPPADRRAVARVSGGAAPSDRQPAFAPGFRLAGDQFLAQRRQPPAR